MNGAGSSDSWTDSPWFWVALFSATALLLIAGLQGKVLQRRSQLERRYFARQQSGMAVRAEGRRADGNAEPGAEPEAGEPGRGSGLTVWIPLYAILAVMLVASTWQLALELRERLERGR